MLCKVKALSFCKDVLLFNRRSVVLTNFGVCFSMTPATSHASKMAVHRTQRIFSAREVVKLVLQPGSDEEEDVVGAFSDSDTELLDSDDDYIPVLCA